MSINLMVDGDGQWRYIAMGFNCDELENILSFFHQRKSLVGQKLQVSYRNRFI